VDWVLLGSRLVLAGVLGVAGVAKLFDRARTRQALTDFGVPSALARPLGWLLPVAELTVALPLLFRASAWGGALGVFGLLLAFTTALGLVLARGQRPSCGCFGQLRPSPVGWSTLARNGAFLAMAGLVVAMGRHDPGPGAEDWLASLSPVEQTVVMINGLAVGLLVALVVMGVRLLGQQTRILDRLQIIEDRLDSGTPPSAEREEARPPDKGLPVGAPAPGFELPDLDGEPCSLAGLLQPGRPILLLFVGPECDPCRPLATEIGSWQRDHAAALRVVVVSHGNPEENRTTFGAGSPASILLQAGSEVADTYAADWTPAAVLISRTGRLASAVAYGEAAIRSLVSRAAASPDAPFVDPAEDGRGRRSLGLVRRGPARLGDPAPRLARTDLDGRAVDLADYRGRDTLVVFWQPECPHCQRLAEDLRRWEAEPPRGAPRLLVVSSGSVEANRALGLQSSVVLDEGLALGKAFGVRGTPSAVLVSADGRIASTVGVGARDVLALAAGAAAVPRASSGPPNT
jgi:peroxiredoxin